MLHETLKERTMPRLGIGRLSRVLIPFCENGAQNPVGWLAKLRFQTTARDAGKHQPANGCLVRSAQPARGMRLVKSAERVQRQIHLRVGVRSAAEPQECSYFRSRFGQPAGSLGELSDRVQHLPGVLAVVRGMFVTADPRPLLCIKTQSRPSLNEAAEIAIRLKAVQGTPPRSGRPG